MKKFSKIFLMLIAIVAIMIFGVDVVSAAAAPQQLLTGPSSYAGNYIGGTYFETKTLSSGGYAYCLNINKKTTTNVKINRSNKMDNGFAYIIKNGYPNKSITGDSKVDYYITQMAVWLYQDETGQNEVGFGRNLDKNFRVLFANHEKAKKVVSLVDGALRERNKTVSCQCDGISSKVDDNNLYISKSGKYYVSKPITVTSAASYAVSFDSAPEGVFAANSNGEKKSAFAKGETFNVYVPKEKVSVGTTKFTVKMRTDYTVKCKSVVVYEYKPENAGMQSVIPAVPYEETVEKQCKNDTTLTFSVTVKEEEKKEEKGEIKVIKIDASTGEGVSGATIEFRDESDKVIDSWTSNGDYHTIKNVENGVYYIVETKAPKGYVLDSTPHKVVIDKTTKEATITIKNVKEEKRIVYIDKVDKETGERIAGAVLVVRDSKGNVFVEFTTSDTVYQLDDIQDGTYTVEEKEAPKGYVKSDEIITITVDDKHVSQTITFTNVKEVTDVPDTASNASVIAMVIGMFVIATGLGYVVYISKK